MVTQTLSAPDPRLADARRACERIAPTWPLDSFIAVNPFWPLVDRPFESVAAEVGALSGARLYMSASWFRARYEDGTFDATHLSRAARRAEGGFTLQDAEAYMKRADTAVPRRARLVDVVDATRNPARQAEWSGFIVRAISQFCASVFDGGQAQLRSTGAKGLYARWQQHAGADLSPALLMGARGYGKAIRALPHDADAVISLALNTLGIPDSQVYAYLSTLLLDVNGWASWCAYRSFQAGLSGESDPSLYDLLAIRVAWDLLLFQNSREDLAQRWSHAIAGWPTADAQAWSRVQAEAVLQDALELAWQDRLHTALRTTWSDTEDDAAPAVQAAFCIDVRSEVLRRALEAQDPSIETIGFAGFFGMPVDYQPVGSSRPRAQLPGLLAPQMRLTDQGVTEDVGPRRARKLDLATAWKGFKSSSVSSFAFVDAVGPVFAARLLRDSLPKRGGHSERAGLSRAENEGRKPRLTHTADGDPIELSAKVGLAAGILRAMGLTRRIGRLVALVGHGSQTRNNPHAAGLDCGACCGQSGAVNARAASALLNDPDVRQGLADQGTPIPATTWFVPGLHDTTTDDVHLLDLDDVPTSHRPGVVELQEWFATASSACRQERAPRLGLAGLSDDALHKAVTERATSWASVQPEWGLADNAAFVIAPRTRTRSISLEGRSFLHDYHHQTDDGYAVLEAILTAPLLVTHWINQQYNASATDLERYGSGNKVLHNVVGAHVGVFEGNGGDLRIGLPLQCVHDGDRFMHTPQRLTAYVEAPQSAIDAILDKHAVVKNLVANGWVHLVQIDGETRSLNVWRGGEWQELG